MPVLNVPIIRFTIQTASQYLAASIAPYTRVRLTTKEILLCFLGSGIFILIGTITINFFQNKQRPRNKR